ncbi:hypothetical protein TanjilG_17099 [Lupinus angustifolius]|uniref:Uncharacterized protein n=1 Tax=Lupinus angustifolius TaxID=3871 RepID=A0A4P1R0K9_LUPAN|nr:PREDICTED: uncharacterized protein LOC109363504 [Lupinus angustifolius]OIV99289.1 hypothetical protein TanjilG_17099 [Lupinus angustifolius]
MVSSSSSRPLNCSKAQMSFFKILDTISSVPPSTEENPLIHGDDDRSASFPKKSRGIDIDLNVSIYPTTEFEESESFVVNQENKESFEGKESKVGAVEEKSVGTQVQSFEVENKEIGNVESEAKGEEGGKEKTAYTNANSLDFRVEAAKVESERNEPKSEEEKKETSSELRSARARNSVLPVRYKDSVVGTSTKRKQTPRMVTKNTHTRPRR